MTSGSKGRGQERPPGKGVPHSLPSVTAGTPGPLSESLGQRKGAHLCKVMFSA